MFTKYFYLIRHGETVFNEEKRRQDNKGGLSTHGVEEVETLGKRLSNMEIQKMFVSPFERTKETANILNKYLKLKDKKIIFTNLIAERKNPTCIVGLDYDDTIAKSFVDTMDKSIHDENLRLYDEENFLDLKNRALKAEKFLLKKSSKYNLCVTHGIFLKMFLSILLYGKDLKVKDYIQMNMYNTSDNAGITFVKYSPIKKLFAPINKFIDSITEDDNSDDENIESIETKSKIDKYSPWEIIAYNDYIRDGFKRNKI